jgi:S1-C subfamily serine protease
MTAAMLAALALCAAPSDAVVVQFLSAQCPHCKAMEPIVTRLADAGCPVQVVDVDQQPDVARQFKLTGVPTFVGLSKGRETGRIVGATSFDKLLQLYQGAQGGGKQHEAGVPTQPPPYAVQPASFAAGEQPPAFQQAAFHAHPPSAMTSEGPSPEQAAMTASVRLKVEDGKGFGFGTGTIIDTHEDEALVVTCGHLFRESQGRGKITADVFAGGRAQTVEGELISYDLDRDIALVSVRVPFAVEPARIGPPGCAVRPGDQIFTIGCDKGQDPTVRRSHITAVNKYVGRPNYTAAGQPVDGRSGGGLFTAEGLLIGICNAADPADDEGLYAGLASIHWQLDQIGQSEIYQRGARREPALASAPAADAPAGTAGVPALAALQPYAAANVPAQPLSAQPLVTPASYNATAVGAPGEASLPDLRPIAAGDDTEIVFIVRSKRDPSQRSEVFVVDQAAPDLLARITHAARASGQQRAATAMHDAVLATGQRDHSANAAVVRGQSEQ